MADIAFSKGLQSQGFQLRFFSHLVFVTKGSLQTIEETQFD